MRSKVWKNEAGLLCCCDCDFSSQFLTNVKNHIEAKHLQSECQGYNCANCGKLFKTKNSFQTHKSRFKGRCSNFWFSTGPHLLCQYYKALSAGITKFEDFEAQVNSKVLKDELDGLWRCSDCSYSTQYQTNLRGHIETHHVTSAGYLCPTCSKYCLTKNALRIHKRRYHTETTMIMMPQWINDWTCLFSLCSLRWGERGNQVACLSPAWFSLWVFRMWLLF